MKYLVTARETGDVFEVLNSEKEALDVLHKYELQDMQDGCYESCFYLIVEEEEEL
jgi:hypothetical protein